MLDLDALPFLQARWFTHPSTPRPLDLIVVHCTVTGETGGTARAVQRNFASPVARKGSTHTIVDPIDIVRSVLDGDVAFGASGANRNGLHVEICGMPQQTREQWLDPLSRAAIRNAARCIAAWCARYGIPTRLVLHPDELREGYRGITSHAAVQKAWPSSGHWDPGPHFPWDVLITDVQAELAPTPSPPLSVADYQENTVRTTMLSTGQPNLYGVAIARWDPGFDRPPVPVAAVPNGLVPASIGTSLHVEGTELVLSVVGLTGPIAVWVSAA